MGDGISFLSTMDVQLIQGLISAEFSRNLGHYTFLNTEPMLSLTSLDWVRAQDLEGHKYLWKCLLRLPPTPSTKFMFQKALETLKAHVIFPPLLLFGKVSRSFYPCLSSHYFSTSNRNIFSSYHAIVSWCFWLKMCPQCCGLDKVWVC